MKFIFLFFMLLSQVALACPACYGRPDNNYDEDDVQQMYKKKSFYKNEVSDVRSENTKELPKCDFRLGNANCKP